MSRSDLAVDPATGAVVVGSARYTFPDVEQGELRLRSYTPTGRLNWRQTLTGPEAGEQSEPQLAVDPRGHVQVSTGVLVDSLITLSTFDRTGQPLRTATYVGDRTGLADLAVNPQDGNTYLVGTTFEPDERLSRES